MANLVAILAITHHPFFYRASTVPPECKPDFAGEWVRKVIAYRETLTIMSKYLLNKFLFTIDRDKEKIA